MTDGLNESSYDGDQPIIDDMSAESLAAYKPHWVEFQGGKYRVLKHDIRPFEVSDFYTREAEVIALKAEIVTLKAEWTRLNDELNRLIDVPG